MQVKSLPAGKDSGTGRLRYRSEGRAGWVGKRHWPCWAAGPSPAPLALAPACSPQQGREGPQLPPPISSAAATATTGGTRPLLDLSVSLGTCRLANTLVNQEWTILVFSKSAWQTQKVNSQLHLPTASRLLFLRSSHQGTHTSSLVLGILPALLHTLIPLGQAV